MDVVLSILYRTANLLCFLIHPPKAKLSQSFPPEAIGAEYWWSVLLLTMRSQDELRNSTIDKVTWYKGNDIIAHHEYLVFKVLVAKPNDVVYLKIVNVQLREQVCK